MEPGRRLQEARLAARLTQAELAARARSRALVSAVEAGRHLPRVDAALALAEALGTTAAALFGSERPAPVDAISGLAAAPGTAVRIGFVGAQAVTTPARHGDEGWEPVDDVIGAPEAAAAIARDPQLVVAGCEPGLRLLERLLEARAGTHALAIGASTTTSLAALQAGRLHAAVIHYDVESGAPGIGDRPVVRIHLARWRVGLAGPRGGRSDWWKSALSGRRPVIQRETGAGTQKAFERARRARGRASAAGAPGPRVASHLAASRLCQATGLPAVTIEPAAAAAGVAFHPLENHVVELWLSPAQLAEAGVVQLLEALHSAHYRRTLESVGGYDLSQLGIRVA